jgi:hypothetical protein
MYAPELGRFITKDTWPGNYKKPLSFNRWGYVEGNPVNHTDPSGMCEDNDGDGECDFFHYNAMLAVSYAKKYDLHHEKEPGYYPGWDLGGVGCTDFVSRSLWAGGIRDPRRDPEEIGIPDYEIGYWSKDKIAGQTPEGDHQGLNWEGSPWIVTGDLYRFLHETLYRDVKTYEGIIPQYYGTENAFDQLGKDSKGWRDFLKNNAHSGDVVFYHNGSFWAHAAIIVGEGRQTFHTDTPKIDPKEWAMLYSCGESFNKPRVVERSGSIEYGRSGSRSIDNTFSRISKIAIIHLR